MISPDIAIGHVVVISVEAEIQANASPLPMKRYQPRSVRCDRM